MGKRQKRLLVSLFAICVCIAVLFAYWTSISMQLPSNVLNFEAELIEVKDSNETFPIVLTVNRGGEEKKVHLQRDSTMITDKNDMPLQIQSLIPGQRVELYVTPDVFYEPIETYICCYKIMIL